MYQFNISHDGIRAEINDGDEILDVFLENGEIKVKLPYDIDLQALSKDIAERGYFISTDEWDNSETQSWGEAFDKEGYYPNSIYKERGQWIFTLSPEDYQLVDPDKGEKKPVIGERFKEEFDKWYPIIKKSKIERNN